jgi:putative flippase GtrA
MQRSLNLFKKNCEIKKQFILFLLVGGINTLFGYGVYALFIYLGVNYFFSSLISLFFGIMFNFLTIGKLVFRKLSFKIIKKFISCYMLLYIFYVAFIKIFSLWQSNLYICGMLAVMFMSIISFMANKYLIFL